MWQARLGSLKAQGAGFGERVATSDQSCWTSGMQAPPTVPSWRSGTWQGNPRAPGPPAWPSQQPELGDVSGSWANGTIHSAVGPMESHCHSCGTVTPFLLLWGDIRLRQQMEAAPSHCSLFWGGF